MASRPGFGLKIPPLHKDISLDPSQGYRRILSDDIKKSSVYARYKHRAPTPPQRNTRDPCKPPWEAVMDCYARANYRTVLCMEELRALHDCTEAFGTWREQRRELVRMRYHIGVYGSLQRKKTFGPPMKM